MKWLQCCKEAQLRKASEEGNIQLVTELLTYGINIDGRDKVSLISLNGTIIHRIINVLVSLLLFERYAPLI